MERRQWETQLCLQPGQAQLLFSEGKGFEDVKHPCYGLNHFPCLFCITFRAVPRELLNLLDKRGQKRAEQCLREGWNHRCRTMRPSSMVTG